MDCQHPFRARSTACPHPAPAEAERCLWHNPSVRKDDAYVARLVAQAAGTTGGDLEEAHLAGLAAPGLRLPQANLMRADLRDAVLDGADLSGARLGGANLKRCSLKRARLAGADLSGADLTGANLHGADLAGANLTGALLDGTVLNAADLTDTDFTDADLRLVRWNRRTRRSGARHLPESMAEAEARIGALADGDPEDDRTREHRAVALHPSAARPAAVAASDLAILDGPNGPLRPAPQRRAWLPWTVASGALLLALAASGLGIWGLHRAVVSAQPDRQLEHDLDVARRQAEANLAEVRKLQGLVAKAEEDLASVRTDATRARNATQVAQAQTEEARRRLAAADADLVRLRDAGDRAAVMALRLDETQKLAREQADQLGRQQRMGEILAQGSRRLGEENARLDKLVSSRLAEEHRAELLAAEVAKLKLETEQLKSDRDAIAGRERRQAADLADARQAMEGYLKRIADADLGHLLGDGDGVQPLLPLKAGAPIALGGDYLVSLRVDPVEGGVTARLVVQRPAAAANPDVTLMLYDRDEQPLRRIGFGFPHVDQGSPFVSGSVTVACDRAPAFARVLVAPGVSAPMGKK